MKNSKNRYSELKAAFDRVRTRQKYFNNLANVLCEAGKFAELDKVERILDKLAKKESLIYPELQVLEYKLNIR